MSEQPENKRIKIGGLWEQTSKKGAKYLMGSFTYGTSLMIFQNDKRPGKKDPDYTVYLVETPPKPKPIDLVDLPPNDQVEGIPF